MKCTIDVVRTQGVIEYALIVALYYVTGGAFSYTGYNIQITLFFFVTFILCILFGKINVVLQKGVFTILFLESIFILLVPILNMDEFSSYFAIIMQLFIGAFCSAIIPIENFRNKYIRVIVFFAAVSLMGYVLGFIYPSIINYFPVIIGTASVDYYNAIIYVFMTAKGYASTVLTTRNAGICWEPGCYQMFLNIALFFLLNGENRKHEKKFVVYFFILVITIFTTMSTTGIILLCLNIIRFRTVWLRYLKKNKFTLFGSCIVALMLLFLFIQTDIISTIIEKVDREFFLSGVSEGGALDRISFDKIRYIFVDGLWIFGMSFPRWLTYGESLWNSVIHSFLCLGTPFTVVHLYGYWRGSRQLAYDSVLLFVIMVVSASTETFFWRVLFNTIVFYGAKKSHFGRNEERMV